MLKSTLFSLNILKPSVFLIQSCNVHTHNFSRNLQFISNDKVSNFSGFQVQDSRVNSQPLTLIYSWMLAKDQYVMKYSKLYLDRGINILRIKISLFDLLRPTKGTQVVAGDVLEFLHSNPNFGPLLVHGFSVGGYVFSESMVKVVDNMELHGPLLKRFVGQIWDSGADIYQIPKGIPRSVSNNKVLQQSMEKYLRWYLRYNYETATRHYERASKMMHDNVLGVPGLIIFSATDPISDHSVNIPVIKSWEKKGTYVLDPRVNKKPLTLLYSWMLAKDVHLLKYAKFYLDRDINVLKVKISPFDLLRPTKGSQVVADHMLEFLHANPNFGPLIVHGFSVGAYSFCETMVKVSDNMARHGPLLKRFVGQIWDSVADVEQIPIGLPKAITENKILQKSMEKYLRWYLKFNYESATRHYERSSQMMHTNTLGAPGLFIFSKSDPVSNESVNMPVVHKWEKKGDAVFAKCFEKSPHVSHFMKYKTEYEEEITAFLEGVGMLHPAKDRAVVS